MIRFLEANGYDVSYIEQRRRRARRGACCSRTTSCSSPAATTSTGRRRSARASRPRATPASTSHSSAATRCSGRPAGSRAPTAATRPTGRSSSYKDTHFDAPQDPVEWTGTWDDPRFATDADGVTPAERAHRPVVHGQPRHDPHHGPVRVPPAAPLAQHRRGDPDEPGQSVPARARHAGLRVGRGRRQRVPPGRARSGCRRRRSAASRCSPTTAARRDDQRHRHAQHDAVPRRPAARCVFGAGTVQWAWGLERLEPGSDSARTATCAGDGQPVRRHGRAAGDALRATSSRPSASTDTTRADVDDHQSAAEPAGRRHARHAHRHRRPTRRRRRRRRRGLDRRRHAPGIRRRAPRAGRTAGSPTARRRPRSRSAPPTTAATSRPPGAGAYRQRHLPVLDLGQRRHAARRRRRRPVAGRGRRQVQVRHATARSRGVRFYKAAANTGTHIGSLWTRRRAAPRPGDVQRASRRPAGRRSRSPARSRSSPNTTYVASYFAPNGHYSATQDYFCRAPSPGPQGGAILDSPPLSRRAQQRRLTTNGVYAYGGVERRSRRARTAPATTGSTSLFTPTPAPGQVTNVTAAEGGSTSANVTWTRADDAAARRRRTRSRRTSARPRRRPRRSPAAADQRRRSRA